MTEAIIVLSIALTAETVALAVLATSIPFLFWRMIGTQRDLEKLDEIVSTFMDGIKINEAIDKTRQEEKGNV